MSPSEIAPVVIAAMAAAAAFVLSIYNTVVQRQDVKKEPVYLVAPMLG